MYLLRARRKLLTRIAQTTEQTPAPAGTTTPSTSPTASPTKTISAPPAFSPISGPWAFISKSYNAPTVQYLAYLLGILNTTIHYATEGEFNLQKNQNNLAQIDASGLPSPDAKNVVLLAKLFYRWFINNGKPFEQKPTSAQINQWADIISHSQPLMNLSQMGQTGQLAQQLNTNYKLDGSFRQNMMNYLGYIKTYNPQAQQR